MIIMTRTRADNVETLKVWGINSALAVALIFLHHTATAAQAPVALGTAASFHVLAGTTVTSTGATVVNGDLGVSPGTAVTGFPPGIVSGTIHTADAVAAQAQLDLTAAYNDAAGRTVGVITVAGNLGGQTLAPGLYSSASSLEISSGDLRLDAQGDPNAVWIFQTGSTLVTSTSRQVLLINGALAANVFWQVGSSATIGVSSVFKGTILAYQSITLSTGAALDGRALARNGAVTLDANYTPTLALLASIRAHVAGATVTVEWQTASELDTLAFDLYRQTPAGIWVLVNQDSVPSLNSIAGGTYSTPDTGASAPGTYEYKLVEWTTDGLQSTVGVYTLEIVSPVRITTCIQEGHQLRLAWTGGVPPYALEKCSNLNLTGSAQPAAVGDSWVGVALADPSATTVLLPIQADARVFFRVSLQP